jgi:hypothetical protein
MVQGRTIKDTEQNSGKSIPACAIREIDDALD